MSHLEDIQPRIVFHDLLHNTLMSLMASLKKWRGSVTPSEVHLSSALQEETNTVLVSHLS